MQKIKSDRWAAGRVIGNRNATLSKPLDGIAIEWKKGPRGQGWHYMTGLDPVWVGCYATPDEAQQKAVNKIEREQRIAA